MLRIPQVFIEQKKAVVANIGAIFLQIFHDFDGFPQYMVRLRLPFRTVGRNLMLLLYPINIIDVKKYVLMMKPENGKKGLTPEFPTPNVRMAIE